MNILITGASSGIGRAAAEYLDSVGHRIVMVARRAEVMQNIVTSMQNDPLCIPYDLLDLENIEQIFIQCKEEGIKLDGLVHCAGINRDMPVKINEIDAMMDVTKLNYMSFVELSKYFSSPKYSNSNCAIVAISSTAVLNREKSMCTYASSKAALEVSVSVMAKEFVRRGIRVNSIQPRFVDTEMTRNLDDFEGKASSQPLGVIKPIDVAYLIEFLLSDRSSFITGANIPMSAGAF